METAEAGAAAAALVEAGRAVGVLEVVERAVVELVAVVRAVVVVMAVLEEQVLLVKVMQVEDPPAPVVEEAVEVAAPEALVQMVHQALEVLVALD